MPSNIPVSTLSAALSLDVSGFESGVKRAEMLSIRWAKTQQETFAALGNPGSQLDMTGAWLRDIEKASRASDRLFSSVTGPRSTGLPTGENSAFINDSQAMADAMADGAEKAAARRLQIEQTLLQEQVRILNQRKAAEEAAEEESGRIAIQAAQKKEAMWEGQLADMTKVNAAQREFNSILGVTYTRLDAVDAAASSAFNDLPANFETLSAKAQQASYSMLSVGNTARDSQDRMRQFNLKILQGGYQLQDFVVQVGSGTNALVAFAQQSSQFAGFFGATGAWVGVGLAVASLAANLLLMGANAKDSSDKVKSLREETDGLLQARRELLELTMGEKAEKAFAGRDVRSAQAEVDRLQSIVDKANAAKAKSDEAMKRLANDPNLAFGAAIMTSVGGATEEDYAKLTAAQTALTEAQAKHARVFDETAEAAKSAAEATLEYFSSVRQARRENAQFGETALQTLGRLRDEWSVANAFGPQDPLQIEKLRHDILSVESALSKEAQAIEDQLDPLAKKRRELEQIRKLEEGGFLAEGTLNRFTARLEDEMRQKVKLPDSFTFSGAQSSGGMVGSGQQNLMVDLTRKMLTELTQIKSSTYSMAGNN